LGGSSSKAPGSAGGYLLQSDGQAQSVVLVVDDDVSLRTSLAELFAQVGLRAETFGSPTEFLRSTLPECPSCLVLDVRLPGLSGLDLQAALVKANVQLPIVFITGHGDIPMSVRAMKEGAFEFLTKPFRDQDLLDAVQRGLDLDRARRERQKSTDQLRARFEQLSPREQEVIARVSAGLMNKQIAGEIGVAEITVKVHRANAMRKLGARTLADVLRIAQVLGLKPH
jgi:FixJ family two-component response regulator